MKDVIKMLSGDGLLKPHQRYVLEIEGLSGVRKKAIESYITENKLSDNDVLNIVIGLGRKQLKGSDVSSAVVGIKGNDYSKKIIAFAKDNKGMKMADGGFMDGVYAKGGSLQAHGIELGDTFIKTISGGIQKVKDKNGKIVYINLSNGERDSQPPLPFAYGGGVKHTFEVGQTISYPITNSTKLDKHVKYLFNKYAEKELVINEIITDKPYNTAKVSLKSTGEKLTGEIILNPRYIKIYANGGFMNDGDMNDHKEMENSFASGRGFRKHNGREYGIGRNWTNDHNQFNNGKDYEVNYRK